MKSIFLGGLSFVALLAAAAAVLESGPGASRAARERLAREADPPLAWVPSDRIPESLANGGQCVSCHFLVDTPNLEEKDQPFRSHPNLSLFVAAHSPHPTERFACVACHDGHGMAMDFNRCRSCHRGSDAPPGLQVLARHDCFSCHGVDAEAPPLERRAGGEGSRVQRAWLARFLRDPAGNRVRVRSKVVHPAAALSGEEVETLLTHFAAVDESAAPVVLTPARAKEAEALLVKYQCLSCHEQGLGGSLAPRFDGVPKRLRREWVRRFLRGPDRLVPGVAMPSFWASAPEPRASEEIDLIVDWLFRAR